MAQYRKGDIVTSRRSFILGAAALIAAPAVIRTQGLLMPVKPVFLDYGPIIADYLEKISNPPIVYWEEAISEPISLRPGLLVYAVEHSRDTLRWKQLEPSEQSLRYVRMRVQLA